MLDMDGEGFDVVVVEEYLDSLPQLDKAIEALTKSQRSGLSLARRQGEARREIGGARGLLPAAFPC